MIALLQSATWPGPRAGWWQRTSGRRPPPRPGGTRERRRRALSCGSWPRSRGGGRSCPWRRRGAPQRTRRRRRRCQGGSCPLLRSLSSPPTAAGPSYSSPVSSLPATPVTPSSTRVLRAKAASKFAKGLRCVQDGKLNLARAKFRLAINARFLILDNIHHLASARSTRYRIII